MTAVEQNGPSNWLVCPQCLSLCGGDAPSVCPSCHFSLTWLERLPVFRDALCQMDQRWPLELRLTASWPGGETELSKPWDSPIRLATGEGEPWEFRTQGPPYQLLVTRAEQTQRFALPCEATLEGLKISCFLATSPDSSELPGTMEDFVTPVSNIGDTDHVILGSEISDTVQQVADTSVDLKHCILVRQPETSHYWIADLGSVNGTFVNRQRIAVARVTGGDFLQVGGHVWTFNESDGLLVPVRPIEGIDLRLEKVAMKGRMLPMDLYVPPGQLIGIAGASGAGKSTLMRALLGEPHSRTHGNVMAGGYDCDRDRDEYCRRLGYVSQKNVVHANLKAQDAVEFGAELRGKPATTDRVIDLLHRLDVQHDLWQKTPGEMSGGEGQRVRIAAELIAGPQLLFLDEPARGLDQGREITLMKLLRGLSYQGCTVVVITHGLAHLDYFDRVLLLEKTRRGGRLCFDGSPSELRRHIPSRDFADLDLSMPPRSSPSEPLPPAPPKDEKPPESVLRQVTSAVEERLSEGWDQLKVLFRREMAVAWNSKFRRLVLPLLFVPFFFALSIGTAVPVDKLHLLGFFAVLASIWMGASLSLLSIVNERAVLDHEHLLFLRLAPYVLAKLGVLLLYSSIQSVIFVLLLSMFRSCLSDEAMLLSLGWVALYLALVGWAAVGVGLVISAASGSRSVVANFILPLVMMVQIVFSVHVAEPGDASADVDTAYTRFNARHCRGQAGKCSRRVEYRDPVKGDFLCSICRRNREENETRAAGESGDTTDSVAHSNIWAAWASSYTLSRYGDMALRSFAYRERPNNSSGIHAYWEGRALVRLVLLFLGLPLGTLLILWLQTSGKTYYLRDTLSERRRRNLSLRFQFIVRSMLDRMRRRAVDSETPIERAGDVEDAP